MGYVILNFAEDGQFHFQRGLSTHSQKQGKTVPTSHTSPSLLSLSFFRALKKKIKTGSFIIICITLPSGEIKQLFIQLFSICISSFLNDLFYPLPIFLSDCSSSSQLIYRNSFCIRDIDLLSILCVFLFFLNYVFNTFFKKWSQMFFSLWLFSLSILFQKPPPNQRLFQYSPTM